MVAAEAGDGGGVLSATGRRGRATVDANLPRRIGRARTSGIRPPGHVSCAVSNRMNSLPRILVPAGILAAIPAISAPRQDLIDRRDPHLPFHVTTNSFTGDSFTFGDVVDDDATIAANGPRRSTAVKATPHGG